MSRQPKYHGEDNEQDCAQDNAHFHQLLLVVRPMRFVGFFARSLFYPTSPIYKGVVFAGLRNHETIGQDYDDEP